MIRLFWRMQRNEEKSILAVLINAVVVGLRLFFTIVYVEGSVMFLILFAS